MVNLWSHSSQISVSHWPISSFSLATLWSFSGLIPVSLQTISIRSAGTLWFLSAQSLIFIWSMSRLSPVNIWSLSDHPPANLRSFSNQSPDFLRSKPEESRWLAWERLKSDRRLVEKKPESGIGYCPERDRNLAGERPEIGWKIGRSEARD